MKTATAIKKAGSASELAALLGISRGAVSQWPEDVPEARVWQLRVLRPQWFMKPDKGGDDSQPVLVIDKKKGG